MQRFRTGGLLAVGLALALAGCTGSNGSATPTPRGRLGPIPTNSPLTTCVDPSPAKAKPVDADVAKHFTDGRIASTLSLDGGKFRATPPAQTAKPKIDAKVAYCNLLAGVDSGNRGLIESVPAHGVSFGLGMLTVEDSLEQSGPEFLSIGPSGKSLPTPKPRVTPYRKRLAWIAVFKPDHFSSCTITIDPGGTAPPQTAPKKALPGYQILAIDADTGANGILYSSTTNNPCGTAGTRAPNYSPAKISVSVPWTLVKRGPATNAASITFEQRPCDVDEPSYDIKTNRQIIVTDHDRPNLVRITVERVLMICGPAKSVPVMLHSEQPANDLPARLVHAPTGAMNTRD